MTVIISQPELNIREKLADLDRPVGSAGARMLLAETPQEQQALIGVGRRNLLINGAFQVWQRGTSSTSFTGGTRGYIADRWSFRYATSAERSTDVPEGETFKYSIKVVVASTSPDSFIIQGIEDSDRLAGQTVTLSYWIKPSESCVLRTDYYRTPHGPLHEINGNVWQKVTNTFVVPSDITVNEFLYIQFPANKVITFYLTGVQLELGKVATPFEHRSYGEELALCQRYFQLFEAAAGHASSTTAVEFTYQWNTEMRAAPSASASAALIVERHNITIYTQSSGGVTITQVTPRAAKFTLPNLSGLTAGNAYSYIGNHSSSGHIELSAEL